MIINHQIITLQDNKKYFVLEELLEERERYCLILNIEDDSDVKITLRNENNGKLFLKEVDDKKLLNDLSLKFKTMLEKDQEMYS